MNEPSDMLSIRDCRQLINNTLSYFAGLGYKKFSVKEEFLMPSQVPPDCVQTFLHGRTLLDGQQIYGYQLMLTHENLIIFLQVNTVNLEDKIVKEAQEANKNLLTILPPEPMKVLWNDFVLIFMTSGFMEYKDMMYERIASESQQQSTNHS